MSAAVGRLHRQDRPAEVRAQASGPSRVDRLLRDADIQRDQLRGLKVWAGCGSAVCVGASLAHWWLGVAVAVGLVLVPVGVLLRLPGRRERRLVAALPAALDTVARTLRTGGSLAQSIADAAASAPAMLGDELNDILRETRQGRTLENALASWVDRTPRAEVRVVAVALALASVNEAGATRAIEGVGQSLRDRLALDDEITALTAQASASMQVLVALPVAFLVADGVVGGQALRYLVATPFGRVCLAVGLLLEVMGWLWMRAMVRSRLP